MTRILVPVPLVLAVVGVIVYVGQIENYTAVAWLDALIWERLSGVLFALILIAGSGFFLCTFTKLRMAVSRDAKRRLLLLYAGTSVGMTPLFVLVIINAIKGGQLEQHFPLWLIALCFSCLFLFPVTMAYVIVVQRALDVRVVIRQGLRYALATSVIRVLQFALTAGALLAAFTLALNSSQSRPQKITVMAIGVAAVFLLRKGAERLRVWTDRRFFRDAYNAEQILAGLSDEVRSMVETRPLLERVATRIAESLHVPRVAVLLLDGGLYRPAYASGYAQALELDFAESAATVRRLRQEPEPARVYFDDEDSWVNSSALPEEERRALAALESQLLLPLAVKEKLLGIISLGEKRSEEPYSSSDLRLLKSVAVQTGLALSNAQLTTAIAEEVSRREKMLREVEIAREVQERLFPQKLPPVAGLDYCGRCRTALGVGGDYFDFLALPEGKLGIALGDVSGKGIAAALLMASLQASLRAEAMRARNDIAGLIARVNELVHDASAEDRYATLFYAQYDSVSRRLAYVNAGHNPPMLFRRSATGRSVERLDEAGGTVVGLLPECSYAQAEVTLAPGDFLVIYTDGISEAMNGSLEEWGEKRLIEAAGSSDGLLAEEIIGRIMKAADAFAAGASQFDDMTLVILRAI